MESKTMACKKCTEELGIYATSFQHGCYECWKLLQETIKSWEASYNNLIDENDKIKKDLRETIEKQKKEIETLDSIIKYQLYQLKAKDAEIEKLKSTFAGYENFKENERQLKAIAEARELLLNHIAIFESQGLQWCCKKDIQEAKAWLEQNK